MVLWKSAKTIEGTEAERLAIPATSLEAGWRFTELDNFVDYLWNGANWIELPVISDLSLDTFNDTFKNVSQSVQTATITVGAKNDRCLFVVVTWGTGGTQTITSVQDDEANNFTLVRSETVPAAEFNTSVYRLTQADGQSAGSRTITVTFSGNSQCNIGLVSMFNVNQTTPVNVINGDNAQTTNITATITPTLPSSWIFAGVVGGATMSNPNLTSMYLSSQCADTIFCSLQRSETPTLNQSNTASWDMAFQFWAMVLWEVVEAT